MAHNACVFSFFFCARFPREARPPRRTRTRIPTLSLSRARGAVPVPGGRLLRSYRALALSQSWDTTADDPRLLVHLKSYRNTIPVPKHWCQKRKFLMGKRGMEKPPFQLPEFIAATGIEKIRASVLEKENSKKLKGKQKERMQPKMGKIDIDYQVLHDAFFKFQTKPRLTKHGDVYYEGKEHEASLRELRTLAPALLPRPLTTPTTLPRPSRLAPPASPLARRASPLPMLASVAPRPLPALSLHTRPRAARPRAARPLSTRHSVPPERGCARAPAAPPRPRFPPPPLEPHRSPARPLACSPPAGPGQLSSALKAALDMGENTPPPWLVNMQRYGPPPSYASLKIAGLNAPIPEGCSYGFHADGWGKPPVDEFGRPLYGDVFGTAEKASVETLAPGVSREPWGAMEEEEEEEDDEDEDDEDGEGLDDGTMTDDDLAAGISSVSSTAPSGVATPDSLHLRKHFADGVGTPSNLSTTGLDTPGSVSGGAAPQLYQVLEQTSAKVGASAFGSSHGYVVPPASSAAPPDRGGGAKGGSKGGAAAGGINLALDPAELEHLDEAALKARYDALRRAEREASAPEDVSDIIEEQERKRKRKLDSSRAERR